MFQATLLKQDLKRDEQIRFIVGDLELNFGDAMANERKTLRPHSFKGIHLLSPGILFNTSAKALICVLVK